MSRVAKLALLLDRLPPEKMQADKLAASYCLQALFVARMIAEAKKRRGLS